MACGPDTVCTAWYSVAVILAGVVPPISVGDIGSKPDDPASSLTSWIAACTFVEAIVPFGVNGTSAAVWSSLCVVIYPAPFVNSLLFVG